MRLKTAICIFLCVGSLMAADVNMVKNEKQPSGTPMTLQLTKTLEKGPEEGDDYIWTGPGTSLQVDKRGHIYVTDTAENRILEYDADGKLVRQIGKTGQGPGEYQALRNFDLLADGTAVAFENMGASSSLTYYDKDINYQDRKTISGIGRSPRYVNFSPDGSKLSTLASIWDVENGREVTEFVILDKDFQLLESLLVWDSIIFDQSRMSESSYWVEFIAARLQSSAKGLSVSMAFDQEGRLYSGKATEYEITVWSPELKPLFKFGRDYERKVRTEEELDAIVTPIHQSILTHLPDTLHSIVNKGVIAKAVERAEFLPYRFPVQGILPMGKDHVLVVHDINQATLDGVADIYTNEGKFIGSFEHARNGLANMIFRDGKAYALEQNADEELIMVRYDAKLVPASKATQP